MYYLIEQTNACNLRCPCCPNRLHQRAKGCMSPETFRSIVDQLLGQSDIRNDRVPLHGTGEPLLSPHFWANLDYLESKGFRNVDFTSNGMALSPEVSERLTKYRCLSWVRVSLNSTRGELMEAVNAGADFDCVVSNAAAFISATVRDGSPFQPCVQLMRTRANGDESVEDVYRLFGRRDFPVMEKRLDTFAGQTSDAGLAYPAIPPTGCTFGSHCIYFHWDGDMVGCCFDDTKSQVYGNVREGIHSEAVRARKAAFAEQLARRDFTNLPLCAKCYGVA